MTIDDILGHMRAHLDLEAETEHEILEEIHAHLEEAVEAAQARGLDPETALAEVASRFGLEEAGRELQTAHVGWGTTDGVIAAALPVICALVLRWLAFTPDGTAVGWQALLARPTFWAISLTVLLVPVLKLSRWRYALASWAVFWALSVVFFALSTLHW